MKNRVSTIALSLVFIVGLSLLLYPSISNYINNKSQSEAIFNYQSSVSEMQPEDFSQLFSQAEDYNKTLRTLDYPMMYYNRIKGYDEILNLNSDGMMGYLNIEKLGVAMSIYHGTDESVLNVASGHVKGSSLPIGGKGTHSVISAHRGLPGAELFTDLDEMEIGDTFTITVCDRVLTYEVDQINIVEPKNTDYLQINEDNDYCTLLTCTPYGINTHRLLVRGHRIETEHIHDFRIVADATQIEPIIVAPIVAVPIFICLFLIVFVSDRFKFSPSRRKRFKELMEEVKK